MASPALQAVIFCQPEARRFSGEPLAPTLQLPDRIPAGVPPEDGSVGTSFFSTYLRPNDVPLAFHQGSVSGVSILRAHQDILSRLDSYSRMLQYQFSDGTVLCANQILCHPYSKHVPRPLLPLLVNVTSQLQEQLAYRLDSGSAHLRQTAWQTQAHQVVISALLATLRAQRTARSEGETDYVQLYFCLDDVFTHERSALRLDAVELGESTWGPWRVTTALPDPVSGVYYGRARLELDPEALGDLEGLARNYLIDRERKRLVFHTFQEQLLRLQPSTVHATDSREKPETERHEPAALETGVSAHLAGHAHIQATLTEIREVMGGSQDGREIPVFPGRFEIPHERVQPCLALTSDGSVRFMTKIQSVNASWEAHGIPQSSAYILLALQNGIGAPTGYAAGQLAHSRRGLKRERDLKVLRHLGFASLIFYDAVNFALDLPLSDGSSAQNEKELCQSLFARLGAIIVKTEGWPTQASSLDELCSKNVTTLIEGFVQQVIGDIRGREIHLYLPEGELRLQGLSRAVVLFFHALIADLADETTGSCFSRARTKYFENFMNGRASIDKEDLAVRTEVDALIASRIVHHPGIRERYLLPESSIGPRGMNLFALLQHGFQLQVDGKTIEEFDATDFRPEFTLREETDAEPSATVQLGIQKIDWFELHPKFFFRGVEISTDQAARLSREGMLEFQGKLYRVRTKDLPSFKRLAQFWSHIQGHGTGLLRAKRRSTEETYFHLPRSQTLELLALRSSGVKVQGGPIWQEICRFYDSLNDSRAPLELPSSFKASLQSYQTAGVQWLQDLYHLGLGGILADDMGLGKTVTSLAFLESLRDADQMGPCLVLVPTSLTYNWVSEAERFAPKMPVSLFQSRLPEESMLDVIQKHRQALIICTYGLLQEHSELLQQVEWNCIIFDEAQNLKNITTKRTTAARKLRGHFKICLTGTPLENHYGEFYSLFDLVVPGSLGDLSSFREKFVNPPRVLREDLDFLRLKAKPLLLRRTKAQVMHELPPKIETTIKLPFEENQRRIYRDIASAYNEQIRSAIAQQGESKSQLQMLTALLRLRQACSDPSAIPGVKYSDEPPKVATLLEALQELTESGASALVFTQFLATYERIKKSLSESKIPFYDIHGADSRLSREKKLRGFQEDPQGAVMLMTLKTGGVGLNLTKASYIFHIEPWWNPAVENQATDRAHRMGQTNTVQVYRYLIRESVEEKIEILKDLKAKRFDALFSTSEGEVELGPAGSTLTQEDFEYLLS